MPDVNPLLVPSGLPNEAPAFDKIKDRHFMPAVRAALKEARANIRAIKSNPDQPTFENTIVALETAGETFGDVMSMLQNQVSASGSPALVKALQTAEPLRASYSSSVSLDRKLFARVKAVRESLKTSGRVLTLEQSKLLEDAYDGFRREGAELKGAARKRIKEIDAEMSTLGTAFDENVKKAIEAFTLVLEAEDLEGLPESYLEGAAGKAKEKGHEGKWVVTLDYPSYGPFLDFSKRRDLRERIWHAVNTRCWNDDFDNQGLIRKTIELRHERAQLLGYKDHASYILEERMTGNTETVMKFLNDLKSVYKPAAIEELKHLQAFANEDASFCNHDGSPAELKPWDIYYYMEKMREAHYGFSKADLRDYFPLDKVLEGTFKHFEKFGVKFTHNPAYPTTSPAIKAYDVTDTDTGGFVGTLYADFHPRKGKSQGAWMTEYRGQGLHRGEIKRPVTAIVCNFTEPTGNNQPYLDFEDEVKTLLHEMGHDLDALLQDGTFRSQGAFSREWDAIELPSQIQERWALNKETLRSMTRHKVTGKPIPDDLIDRMIAAQNFMAATTATTFNNRSLLDMAWHTTDPAEIDAKYGFDVFAFEKDVTEDDRLFPMYAGPFSTAFTHIFAGGYSAGYNGYAWADNLAVDAYDYVTERGAYDTERLMKFRDEFIRAGGTRPAAVSYRAFRGQDPDPQALPRSQGLIPPKVS